MDEDTEGHWDSDVSDSWSLVDIDSIEELTDLGTSALKPSGDSGVTVPPARDDVEDGLELTENIPLKPFATSSKRRKSNDIPLKTFEYREKKVGEGE